MLALAPLCLLGPPSRIWPTRGKRPPRNNIHGPPAGCFSKIMLARGWRPQSTQGNNGTQRFYRTIDGAGAISLAATRVGSPVEPASKPLRVMPARNTISIVTMIAPARGGAPLIARSCFSKSSRSSSLSRLSLGVREARAGAEGCARNGQLCPSRRTGRQLRPFEGSYRTPTQWRFTIDLDQSDPYLRLADVAIRSAWRVCMSTVDRGENSGSNSYIVGSAAERQQRERTNDVHFQGTRP